MTSVHALSAACVRRRLCRCAPLLRLAVLLGAAGPAGAQVVTEGVFAVVVGGVLLDGNQATFQQRLRQRKDGVAGLERLSVTKTTDHSALRLDLRFVPGDDDFRLLARWEVFEACYVEAGYQAFRTFYDGSGGRFVPRQQAISWFDESLALDRSFFHVELGTLLPERIQWRLRYDRRTRDGTKNSIRWGDSNLPGVPSGLRAFIPAYLVVDEERDIITAEAGRSTDATVWKVAGRYERTGVGNRHVARRRALEPQDRYVTTAEGATSDLVSGHASYERVFNEEWRASAGGLVADLDSHLTGSKVYGGSPDAEYSPTFARRQAGDVGYHSLFGDAHLRQYLANLNFVYQPARHWSLLPGVKYEHLRIEAGERHIDTDFGGGAAAAAIQRSIEASSRDSWNEFTGDFEVRYARFAGWALSARAQWNHGEGSLLEQSVLLPARGPVIDRDADYERRGGRYTAQATWYARPGLTFGAQFNHRTKVADYTARRDRASNAPNSPDRYPHFIVDQDVASQDAGFRVSWRPRATLGLVARYAYQRATVTSTMAGLPPIESGRLTRHILTHSATWNVTPRLYFTGAANVTFDQLRVPVHRLTMTADNNHASVSMGSGYALGRITDLQLDASWFRADNYTDNPEVTLPLNAGHLLQSVFLTWVRRPSDRLIYTVRYGYASNRDGTFAGLKDFDAHLLHARMQVRF